MKAVRIHTHGDPDVLVMEDIPKPTPEDGEVLVQVHAVALNPVDWKVRSNPESLAKTLPYTIGWDVSGVVVETKSDRFQVGDEVYGMVNFPGEGGGYAEYVRTPAEHLTLKPKSIDFIHAAAIPLAALTARQAFELSNVTEGQRVLIHAAAGGVGHFAVQLAKLRGAYVIGTASAANHEFLRELGVDEVIDYTQVAFEDVVSDVDMVLQSIGGEHGNRSIKTMRDGATMVTIVGASNITPERGIQVKPMLVSPNDSQLEKLAALVDSGKLKPTVSVVYPLEDIVEAHHELELGHTRGKIVLQVV